MTALETLPNFPAAQKVANAQGVRLEELLNAYLAGYAASSQSMLNRLSDEGSSLIQRPYHPQRSTEGRIILPQNWDDPEDSVYDHA